MIQPTISIIVNFYNSGRYIPRLLKSVVEQSFTDWELIAVDDCSPNHDDEAIACFLKKIGGVKR
ncbi:MAG: glycosyltransferase [Clostridium sp.]|nr:glycosyltransferase [Clostridium sp.]